MKTIPANDTISWVIKMKQVSIKKYDVIVVGGGASGLMAAITASRQGAKVVVIDHLNRIGKKILSTGNGKCNYTNLEQGISNYRGNDPAFVLPIFSQFNEKDTLNFFQELGIYPKIKNGYVYPNCEQATAILEVLEMELRRLKVAVLCNTSLTKINRCREGYTVLAQSLSEDQKDEIGSVVELSGKSLIFATGLYAGRNTGCDGSANPYIEELGHHFIDIVPALVQLKSNQSFFKNLAGIRAEITLKLYIDGVKIGEESGELQLTDYGISGIVVFQLSRYAGKACKDGRKVQAVIDFMPQMDALHLQDYLMQSFQSAQNKTVGEALIGLFSKKLIPVLLKRSTVNPNLKSSELSLKLCIKLVTMIKEFTVDIVGTKDYQDAQVCAGGISTAEINNQTLMSNYADHVFFAGELIDIDGKCGGYNLQWAWSSGYVAGKHAAEVGKC